MAVKGWLQTQLARQQRHREAQKWGTDSSRVKHSITEEARQGKAAARKERAAKAKAKAKAAARAAREARKKRKPGRRPGASSQLFVSEQ